MKELLTKLTSANKTFSIVELGCGFPVAHSIMLESGASKVITLAISPYSKEYQKVFTGLDMDANRSVSINMVNELLYYLEMLSGSESFHIAYSIQTGVSCHGFIGIYINEMSFIYHITIGTHVSKAYAAGVMKDLVEDIINKHVFNEDFQFEDSNGMSIIDGAWNCSMESKQIPKFNPELLPSNFSSFCYEDGKWYRVVEVMRKISGSLCLIKGSFNPLHDGHKQLINAASGFSSLPLLCMTTKTLEGKECTVTELIKRADTNPGLMYVIDSNNMYIRELIYDLSKWNESLPIRLFMGIDVFAKFDKSDVDNSVMIHVYHRECAVSNVIFSESKYSTLSSTKLRNEKSTPVI